MSNRIVTRANTLVFGVLLALLGLVGLASWDRSVAAADARAWTRHTYEVIITIEELAVRLRDAETGQRGYLLTANDDYLAPYNAAVAEIGGIEGGLQRLTADNPAQQRRLRALAPLIGRKLEELAQTIQLRRDNGLEAAQRAVATNVGRDATRAIDASLMELDAEEHALLAQREATADRRERLLIWLVLAGATLAAGALLLAAMLLNRAWSDADAAESGQRATALRLRASLDSLSQGVGVFAVDRTLVTSNHCFHVLLDLPEHRTGPGTPYGQLCAAIPLETEDQIRAARAGSSQVTVYERTRPDGRLIEIRRTPMPDGGFVLTLSDMTKRAEAEQVLREATKMQAIGQLTGGIAHDFNNLLTVMVGNLEYVRGKLGEQPQLQARIDRGMWAASRGATLTAQLLAFARKQPLAPTAIDLAATMPDFILLLRRTLGEHVEVRYVETAGLWSAMADAAQLESAMLNLALNARDAMPGGGRLTIELANKVLDPDYAAAHAECTPGDYVMLAVSDTGHGMTPEIAARVFEPFFTTKADGRGTGLGLAMVFGFVKQSGGHIKLYSEPGEGTTVRIYIPRALAAAQAPRIAAPAEVPRGSATILVVEDEPAVREIATSILRELGYRVFEAGDGDEALRVFGQHAAEVDLLLTDVILPGTLRGREVAERIVAIRPSIRVLFMSGSTENSIVHHGRLDDGVHLIGKPFTRDQLARKVATVVAPSTATNVVEIRSGRPAS